VKPNIEKRGRPSVSLLLELEAVRVGSRLVRIRREALDAFLTGREAEAVKPHRADRVDALEHKIAELEARVNALERTN